MMAAPLALTLGDPSGIGPDIALIAWTQRHAQQLPPFALFGEPDVLQRRALQIGLEVPTIEVPRRDLQRTPEIFERALPVVTVGARVPGRCGQPDIAGATLAQASIVAAVECTRQGDATAVVTNPIAKSVMYDAGFAFPGHTEFLAHLDTTTDATPRPVMMIWSPELAVVPVTIHIPLRDVPRQLTTSLIVETAVIVARDFARRFGNPAARLAVAGLNPHAGEAGALGDEDEAIIRPAVAQLRAQGIDASGPLPADTLFHAAARARHDVVLGMYHDQVLAPVKALAFDHAVNVTLGLSFVRTSPDHGTAFDLAGSGKAEASSLIAALKLARRLAP